MVNNKFNQNYRMPPHSLSAEQAVLCGLILNNIYFEDIVKILIASDFYIKKHQIIYDNMHKLFNSGKPIDFITLSEQLTLQGNLNYIGGLDYISEISNNTKSTENIFTYVDIIKQKAVLREIILLSEQMVEYAYQPKGKSIEDLINFASSNIIQLSNKSIILNSRPQNIIDILYKNLLELELRSNSKNKLITGLNTGFKALNEHTLGLQKSDLIIIAARPSMGKTTLAMNICVNVAMLQPKPVLIFSLEMPEEQIIKRILASISRLEHKKLNLNKLDTKEWYKLINSFKTLAKIKNIFIDDSSYLTPNDLRKKAKQIFQENNGLSLIMIDYLQLMKIHNKYTNRNLEITEISRALKALAKEFQIPIIALSQLNRYLEQRSDKRPINADLRESGSLEQDADIIMFIYRDEVYNQESKMKGIAEIIIGKHRNGPRGKFYLKFNGKYSRFDNFVR